MTTEPLGGGYCRVLCCLLQKNDSLRAYCVVQKGRCKLRSDLGQTLLGEFRVGFQATLRDIHTVVFFLFSNPDTDDGFQGDPDDQAGYEYPDEDGQGADDLARER